MDRHDAIKLLKSGPTAAKQWNEYWFRRPAGGRSLWRIDLSGADLRGIDLQGVNFRNARLNFADLREADLTGSDLAKADLAWAKIGGARLCAVDLTAACLIGNTLNEANFTGALLRDVDVRAADFAGARFGATVFANMDLAVAKGLELAKHLGGSTVGTDTLYLSQGRIPEVFLRGCGVPEDMIAYARSMAGALQFYSTFISYSVRDEAFATRLHNDFQAAGIRCWKWDHDARTGRSLWGEIDQAIRKYDRLVLIASASSLTSPAVNREIERALVQEDEREKRRLAGDKNAEGDVLFPVRLDDYLFKTWQHERRVDVTKKVIADARGWETDNAKYQAVLKRLIRDLKAEPA
jgi:hypothetical protein